MDQEHFADNRLVLGLSSRERDDLFAAGLVVGYPPDTVVIEEGDVVSTLYLILSGAVRVYLPETWDRSAEVQVTRLPAGTCFGEFTLFDSGPASASVAAVGEATIYEIPHAAFEKLARDNLALGNIVYRNLLKLMVERLRAGNCEYELLQAPW